MPKNEHPRLDSPRFKANPYPVYARLRTEAPVYRTNVAFWLPAIWIVTRYDDVVRILKDPRFSKDYIRAYPWIPPSMRMMFRHLLSIDPPDHTRLRSLVQKAFTPGLIEGLRERIQGICDDLLDRAGDGQTIELIEAYALPVPLTIISDLLGVPLKDRGRFGPWTKKVAAASASASVGSAGPTGGRDRPDHFVSPLSRPASGRAAGFASLAQEPCAARPRGIAGENRQSVLVGKNDVIERVRRQLGGGENEP